jgi:hypothetical protein
MNALLDYLDIAETGTEKGSRAIWHSRDTTRRSRTSWYGRHTYESADIAENWFHKVSTEVLSVIDIAALTETETANNEPAEDEVETESVGAFVKEQKARRENLFRRVSAQLSSVVMFDAGRPKSFQSLKRRL